LVSDGKCEKEKLKMVPLLLLSLQPVHGQTDMYHSKPWVPENVSPSVATFVSTRPAFGSESTSTSSSSRKPTPASAHTSYSQFAISGKPLVQHSNGLEDQESLETHSFVYLAPPPSTSHNGSADVNLSPVLRLQKHADRQPYSRDSDRRIDQVSMETQYVEEGGVTKLFRKPTKTLQKSTRRNTLGNRRRDPTATRNKPPTQRRRPSPINGVKQQLQQENLGADNKKTRTSETRSLPNIRRAPTKAANRRRTKSRTRNENSFSGQQQQQHQSLVPPRPETRGRPVGKSSRRKASATDKVDEPVTLVNFGDWAAQWDELEEAWYYYNYFTGESTWNQPDQLKHIPFKNPFAKTAAEEQIEEPVPDGDVTGYSPPVTDDFQLPGLTSNETKSQLRQGNLSNHQLKENLEKHLLKVDTKDVKVPAKLPAKGKGKKYASGRDYAKKKQPQVRKAEKGKDYGWLDFLSLPKMKLPNFLGFNSDKQKPLKASKAVEEGGQGVRGKRRILKKHRLTPGLRGCYTRIHELLNLC